MISDDDRHEVAERLRELPSTADADGCCTVWDILSALGMKEGDTIGFVPTDNAMRLADLIDRKTCEFKPTYESVQGFVTLVECSECGWTIEPWNAEDFRYCPNCGAEVRDE